MIILLKISWFVLLAYIILYVLLNYLLIVASSLERNTYIRRKKGTSKVTKIINVVIYAKENLEDLIKLVNCLKNQDYPKEKFNIHIIIDNKHSYLDKVIEHIPDVKTWKLNTENPSNSIYNSISQYLGKSLSTEYVNGYIFLTSSSIVKENFLQRVNCSLDKSDISQACIGTKAPYASTISAISYIYNRIRNRTINAGLFYLTKTSLLFEQGLIISQTLLEKYPLHLTVEESETDYLYKLLAQKVKIDWAPEIIIYDKIAEDIHDLTQWKIKKLLNITKGIKNNFLSTLLKPSGLLFSIVMLKPAPFIYFSACVLALLCGYLVTFEPFNIELWFYIPSFCFVMFIFSDLAAMLSTRCSSRDIMIWLNSFTNFFPEVYLTLLYYLRLLLKKETKVIKTPIVQDQSFSEIIPKTKDYKSDIIITDGKKTFSCQLTIRISSDQNSLTLSFKNKKYSTKSYASIEEAFEEINEKLESKGFKLLICNNCGYFAYSKRSHKETHGTSGHCFYNKEGQKIEFNNLITIWDNCKHYCPKEMKEQILEQWKNSLSAELEAELNKEGNV